MMPKKKSSARTPAPKKLESVPNVYWRSVSMDQLREQDRCIALAPLAEEQQLQGALHAGIQSHRYVRQDSRLWSVLHDGMLTTGRLKAALGMHESAAAAIIGIHPGSRGSSHLISAYSHLVNTTYSTRGMSTATTTNSSSTTSSQKPGSRQQQDHKAATAPVGNQQLQKPFGGLLPRPVMLQQPVSQYHTQPQQEQQQREEQQPELAAAAAESIRQLEAARQSYNQHIKQQASAAAAPPAPSGAGLSSWAVNEVASSAAVDAARQHSERAAAGGDISVKLCWGNTQEAAALYCIMNMFPHSLLEEVGLFELDASQLPAAWEIHPHLLPPLGASPDAVTVHNITLLPEDLQAAAAILAKAGASAVTSSGSTAGSSSSSAARAAQDAAEAAAVQLLLQRGFDRLECAGPRPPPTGVQYADSSDDASGLSSSSSSSAVSSQGEMLDSSLSPGPFTDQPESRSAAPGSSGGAPLRIEEAGSLAFEPVSTTVLRVLQHWQQQQQQEQPVTLVVREAVEVKSHCPFGVRYGRSGKKGRVDLAYKLSPRGCAGRVHPQWIPQLQLHTLATGCQSVLLVSRCAARGVRVYRVWRDDAYLQCMMHLLQELQAAHVLRQIPPQPDSLSRLAAHKPFLNKTVALARGAECIAAVGEDFVAQVPENPVNKVLFWNTL